MQYYLYVLAGSLLYILLQLNTVYNLPDFKWKTFIHTNWIPTVLNLAIGCIIVSMKAELTNIYPITFLSSLMLGISGQALIKKFQGIFDQKVNTVVGL
jgi:uncharacterized membrane protein